LVISAALIVGTVGAPSTRAQGAGVGATPSKTASPDPGIAVDVQDLRPSILRQDWGLDSRASHLGPRADLSRAGLGSWLDMNLLGDLFRGGTGRGGGCDSFEGTEAVDGVDVRLTFETLYQGCVDAGAEEIINRLVNARHFNLSDCTGPVVGPDLDPDTTCHTLVLWGPYGRAAGGVLVYRTD
jgi:hypothetical protein